MSGKLLVLLLAVAGGCSDKKLEVAVFDGLHGATIANMAASGVRQSQVAKDRRFDARPVAQRAIVRGERTDRNPAACGIAIGCFADPDFPVPTSSGWEESMHRSNRWF